jgi:hypothetical protein
VLEFLTIIAILFGGGLAFGLVTGRRSWLALPLAIVFAVVVGVCLGEWSDYSTMFARWDSLLYASATILFYFALVIGPAVAGAVAGMFIRRSCHRTHKKDAAS